MPKKEKSMKNSSRNTADKEKRALMEKDDDSQEYGFAEKALGSAFFEVRCIDDKIRRCKARKKRMKVEVGNLVIVSLRNFDDKTGDIIYVYDQDEVRHLQKAGTIPNIDIQSIQSKHDKGDTTDDGIYFGNDTVNKIDNDSDLFDSI